MDITKQRRINLRQAIDKAISTGSFSSDASFCEHYDLNPSHISQLVKGHGSFGERAARNLEKKVGWDIGFLDSKFDLLEENSSDIENRSLGKRIQEALDNTGIAWSAAALKIGLSAQAATNWKKGKIEKETLKKLATAIGVNADWLLDGTGNMSEISTKTSNKTTNNNVSFVDKKVRKIPILDMVQAGNWREVIYDGIHPIDELYTTYTGIRPEDIFGVRVDGDSMIPRFHTNDELVVDPNICANSGDFVIACNNDYEVTFKKYRITGYDEHGREEFELVPLNPDFAPLNSKIHNIRIIGVVVEHINRLR